MPCAAPEAEAAALACSQVGIISDVEHMFLKPALVT